MIWLKIIRDPTSSDKMTTMTVTNSQSAARDLHRRAAETWCVFGPGGREGLWDARRILVLILEFGRINT